MGRYGASLYTYSWHVANGTSADAQGLAAVLQGSTGNMYIDGNYFSGGADYAEMYETLDGTGIEPGYFVTLDGDKVRIATQSDGYLLGIVTSTPSIVADAAELRWKDYYLRDEWRNVRFQEVTIPEERDEEGNIIAPASTEQQPILNPEWDPSMAYIPRSQREEWVTVGLIGKLLVRDDGTCTVNGYCMPNDDGVATNADSGYRVMKRTGPNQIMVQFK